MKIFSICSASAFGGGFGGGSQRRANQPRKGKDLQKAISITFEEAAFGTTKKIELNKFVSCPTCKGEGAKPGTSKKTCPKCGGSGQISQMQRTPFGQFQSVTTCDQCGGSGKIIDEPCPDCKGQGKIRQDRYDFCGYSGRCGQRIRHSDQRTGRTGHQRRTGGRFIHCAAGKTA